MNYKYYHSFLSAVSLLIIFAIGCGKDPVSSQNDNPPIYGDSHVYFDEGPSYPVAGFDFGYTPQNSKISHIYWLHNTGEDVLNIIDIKPG